MFPYHFKNIHVNPLREKLSLPANDLNSYRPIYNLSFIYKVLENPVTCLNVHLNCNHLSNVFQSAYKQFHSTEIALLKIHNDVLLNIDIGKFTPLKLLDLFADFDNFDYSVLLNRLSHWDGISGAALTLTRSFLRNRSQSIK